MTSDALAQPPGEMRTHVGVLQRAMEMLERSAVSSQSSAISDALAVEHQPSPLLRASGFARVKIRYSAAVPDLILHNLLFTHLDYAAIGYRS